MLHDYEMLNIYLSSRMYSLRKQERSGLSERHRGTWYSDQFLFDQSAFKVFVDLVSNALNQMQYEEQEGITEQLQCLGMWGTISDRFGHDKAYDLNNAIWNGVYFVQAPKDCGGLVFSDPRANNLTDKQKEAHGLMFESVRYDAVSGKLILYPSWLSCRLAPNRSMEKDSDGERILLQFQMGLSGSISSAS